MLVRQTRLLLNQLCSRTIFNCRNYYTETAKPDFSAKDPAEVFFDREIQQALKKLTRINYERVFRQRKTGERVRNPTYKFMTDQQLKREMIRAQTKAEKLIQMPPVVKPREEIDVVYSKDYALQGFDTVKYVFTDITYGISDKKRLIAVREPNGVLRAATWDERQRMNQAYFPTPFREMETPQMFKDVHLARLLKEKHYEFILDRACIQFDPDDPEYQRIVQKVYMEVNNNEDFNALRSTRHFGAMVFHLLWVEDIDNLLLELLKSQELDEAALLIQLYYKIHPCNDLIVNELIKSGGLELIECYAHTHSTKPQKLKVALNNYMVEKTKEEE